jgi:uracil phosphoribosyltransferase
MVTLHINSHPVASHLMTQLRDKNTKSYDFRRILQQLAPFLFIPMTSMVATELHNIETPLEPTMQPMLSQDIVGISVMRSGNIWLENFLDFYPQSQGFHLGIARNADLSIQHYYSNITAAKLKSKTIFIFEPMLASGNSLVETLKYIEAFETGPIYIGNLCCCAQGIETIKQNFSSEFLGKIHLYTFRLERGLNDHAYLLPGIGDAGDRLYNSK